MAHLSGPERARYVQGMFTRIASHYDLMNRLMTFGQDMRWRKAVIQRADLPAGESRLLDLGGGTGDLGFEARRQAPACIAVEADLTLAMLQAGKNRPQGNTLHWTVSDALQLPFPDQHFDALVSGFLLRNVIDLPQALREQWRVLKPGGRLVALDTTPPGRSLISPLVRFHMHTVIPFLGRLISGQDDAYIYLPASSEQFLPAEVLATKLGKAGFRQVGFRRLNFGTIAIHWGIR